MKNRTSSSASATASTSTPAKPQPLTKLRIGRLSATIWENTHDNRTFHNVTFARTYRDEQKNYHDADSFGRDDLLVLAKLADRAHTVICERIAELKQDDEPQG